MTDLDQHIHEDLERLTSLAPLPPSTDQIMSRKVPARSSKRPPVLVGLAAAAIVIAAVAGAIVLRQAVDSSGDDAGVAQPTPAETDPDITVFMNPSATQAQIDAIGARLQRAPEVLDVIYLDHLRAFAEFQHLYGDDHSLIGSVTPEVLPTSFRITLQHHDVAAADALLTELEQSPGVREVADSPVATPPEEIPNEAILPRLVIDLPGWSAPDVTGNSLDGPLDDDNDQRTVVYQDTDTWLPLISVLTTTGGYGLGNDNRTIEVAGHEALLSPRYGTTQVIGWEEEGETMVMTGYGVDEDTLVASAVGLVRDPDGRWELVSAPAGMDEVYRTGQPSDGTGRNLDVHFTSGDGGDVELHESTNGEEQFWESVTDVLFDGPAAESVSVRGVSGLLTELDGEYRVDWLDREGTVAMRLDLCCELIRADALEIVDHLVEIDLDDWRQLTGSEPPTATTSGSTVGTVALDEAQCPAEFTVTDEDGDGVRDTCGLVASRTSTDGGCMLRDTDADGEDDDCVRIYTTPPR